MKRLVIELEDNLHKKVKSKAFQKEISMKDYVTELIKKDLRKEEKDAETD